MADINIEKKESTPIWPWILGILALLVILALVFWPSDDDVDQDDGPVYDTTERVEGTTENNTMQTAGMISQPVQEYISWVEQNSGEMGLDHEFTNSGLNKLTAAIASIAVQTKDADKDDFKGKFETMNQNAEMITEKPMSTEHANEIKKAFQANVDILEDLQESSFPDMEQDVKSVKKQVDDLDPKTLTLEQKGEVRDVFRRTAEVLEKMDRSIDS